MALMENKYRYLNFTSWGFIQVFIKYAHPQIYLNSHIQRMFSGKGLLKKVHNFHFLFQWSSNSILKGSTSLHFIHRDWIQE